MALHVSGELTIRGIDGLRCYGAAKVDVSGSIGLTRTLDLTADVSNVLNATIFSPPFLPETAYDNEWMGRNIRIGFRYRFR